MESKFNEFMEKVINRSVKDFLARYYDICRACPICADVKENMIFNEEEKQWYCLDYLKNK